MRSTRALHTAGATALGCLLTASSLTVSSAVSTASTGSLGADGPLGSSHALGSVGAGERDFDLQAHRGGVGLHVESSPQAFSAALELGVSTLELDTQVTADGAVVVTHDRRPRTDVCQDTAPVVEGDPLFPYMDNYIHQLTLEQVRTLDCGSLRRPGYPAQQTHPGEKMMLLSELFDLVKAHGADGPDGVWMNIETKVEAGAPDQTAPREEFVSAVHEEIADSGLDQQITVQSFDWGALRAMHELAPALPLVALTNHDFLGIGSDDPSPWLGGIDIADFDGDGVAAAASLDGVVAYSPVATHPDQSCTVGESDCRAYVTAKMVESAHSHGLRIIPWTVNNVPTMEYLMDIGVDGIITDYPNLLRDLMAERGRALPRQYTAEG
ncbi:glycerophosphodiester phosphodiesterase [Dietzia sp. SLG310A2-38A2]|uniref:glycerophosphodiester phosphodiesterase family protein n=1 Tax=Dietzia sp. SLG310A2-38A2 TaxID=1630643 RepID=UPI0015FD6788|nr:glycerophosphodiester phosphodiesterase family protein [Dietzia sp. SLG310A2-38A2]MBB1031979.1 glycerophosphodiester phosphodiesterase [Dietzia sp. SLG310A2-38A2]